MDLNIEPLQKAFHSLTRGMERAKKDLTDLEVRDGCIQRFEYTYELSIKLIKRYIEKENPISENVDQMNFRDLLRLSAEIGLIKNVQDWFVFREAHNNTSYNYDEGNAKKTFETIPSIIEHIQFLINKLNQNNCITFN